MTMMFLPVLSAAALAAATPNVVAATDVPAAAASVPDAGKGPAAVREGAHHATEHRSGKGVLHAVGYGLLALAFGTIGV